MSFTQFRRFNCCKLEIRGNLKSRDKWKPRIRRADSAARFRRFRANRSRASRERSHENGASTAMRPRRMRCSADARGKCKYVKARPEFSYSRCPPPRGIPRARPPPLFKDHCIALTRCNFPPYSLRDPASHPFPRASHCVRVHLPAPSRTASARIHTHTRTAGSKQAGARARAPVYERIRDIFSLGM